MRKYDKPSYCPVCLKPKKKLTIHILQHSSDPMVAEYLAAPKNVRNLLWIRIQNLGNDLHNYNMLKQGGDLSSNDDANANDYCPCVNCLWYYSKREFYQ